MQVRVRSEQFMIEKLIKFIHSKVVPMRGDEATITKI